MTPNEARELEVQQKINKHVDAFESFRFNAGAGAGKTYALIETLKYITVKKIAATKSPQKAVCITYTNVAVNEIKSRLGNSDTVYVSTIHERVWEIIKRSQPQLLTFHKKKIEEAVRNTNQELCCSDKAQFFIKLDNSQQQEFTQFVMQTKELFYQSKKLKAGPFRIAYKNNIEISEPTFLDDCLKNLDKFKYVAGLMYKSQRLEECLERIDSGKEERVIYDSKVNTDRLHYMKFSHDTLLEYGLKLVETYPTLCRIIIDSYPYFFVDEYQDAHSNVVKFFKTIHDYAIENNKDWVVGYFGDTAQSIYDDGVGRKIADLHVGLVDVDKIFNRRSHQQIIDVVNNIRDDELVQEPIFNDRNNGSVRFFYNSSENQLTTAQQFLDGYKNDILRECRESGDRDDEETKIHCLVLTNKLMASFNGFGDVYDVYKRSGIYYDNLNTQVLSQQLEKLHPTILIIYNFVRLYQDIQKGMVSYYDIFGSASKNMAFSEASVVVSELKSEKIASLNDWIELIIDRLENSDVKKALGRALINRIRYKQDDVASADVFRSILLGSINDLMNEDSEIDDKTKEKIDSVLTLPIISLINWAKFLDGIETGDIRYHTYHGAKGEEYKNVAILLGHSFGKNNKDKFKNYFNAIQRNEEEREGLFSDLTLKEKHINTQNLLYVACSRATKNLRVLYLDDISEIEEGVEAIFGESMSWPIDGDQSSE